jgi:two-component system response regulator FixJ
MVEVGQMPEGKKLVFVVDDNVGMLDYVSDLLKENGKRVAAYGSARKFLDEGRAGEGACLIADIRMPDMSGLDLQNELRKRDINIPTIFMTGYADTQVAVQALKAGALEFIEKPFDETVLLESVNRALEISEKHQERSHLVQEANRRIAGLTEREVQVFRLLLEGHQNKRIAADLNCSRRTVEIHRANVFRKLEVRNLVQLVRLGLLAGWISSEP